jgi:adenylate cyclase
MLNVPLATDNPLRDKIVLIGAGFQDSRDFFYTPYGLLSGLEIQANIIHTLLTRSEIRPAQRILAFGLLAGFGVATSLFVTLLSPTMVTILSLGAIPLLLIPLSYLAFSYLGVWVDFVTPLIAMRWGSTAAEYFEARRVRKSLGDYVGWEVAKQIVQQDESLSGEKREVSVFFADMRNFTTLCEGLAPEQVVARMNELFAMMGKIIAAHNGSIIDFIGDAVLAVFGAPKEHPRHAHAAVQAALEIVRGLEALNSDLQERGIEPLRIGIGIHTGEVIAGIIGTGERKKFDVTGDAVNIGSRVEGLNKELGTTVLATRETIDKVGGAFAVLSRGAVAIKGREQAVEVYEVLLR